MIKTEIDKAAMAFRGAIATVTTLVTIWFTPAGHSGLWECVLVGAFFFFAALLPELSTICWRAVSRRAFPNR